MSAEPVVFVHGSTDYQSATNSYVLELTVQEQSISVETNTSQVSYTLKLISGSNNRFTMHRIGAAVWLNGVQVGYRDKWNTSQISLGYNSSVVLLSDTATVYHNADGSCTMPVVFSIDIENNAYTPGPQTASGQMTLSVIPRKSSIGATDADIGKASAVAVAKQAESFTHSIAYSFGDLSGYLTADGGVTTAETIFAQSAIGAAVDGIPGPETLSKTVTVSQQKNSTHPVIAPVQRRLAALGYNQVGEADGIAGTMFTAAVTAFQRDHGCWVDGEITAGNKTWKKLLEVHK